MIRPLLQFLGFASTAVWSMILVGVVLTGSVGAQTPPVDTLLCPDCYVCQANKAGCDYQGTKTCTNTASCTCVRNDDGTFQCGPQGAA